MIPYSELPGAARIFFIILCVFAEINDIVLFVFLFLRPNLFRERHAASVTIIWQIIISYNIIFSCSKFERFLMGYEHGNVPFVAQIPASILFTVIFIMIAYNVFNTSELITWWSKNLSAFSVKHSMDALPEGLCYYDEEGKVFVVNRTMNEIALILTGETIQNGLEFFEGVKNAKIIPKESIVINEDDFIVVDAVDSVFSFRNTRMKDEFGTFYEFKVADITEEYLKTQELHAKQEELKRQQEYLSQLGETIKQVTIKKEILSAKINVHDRLGENLIAARRYLATGEGDMQAINKLWFDNLMMLSNPQTEMKENPLNAILAAASDIGITLVFDGEINEDSLINNPQVSNAVLTLIANTLHECITNTMRHAKGDTVYVNINSDYSLISFRNNGDLPTEIVRETGGLLNVRKQANNVGYKMMIISFPEFKLILKSIL